jgi:hypothetical protein
MIEYLPIVLTGLGLTASILYYTSVLRNANKTREAQLFMQIYDKWSDPDMLSSFEIVSATELSSIEDFLETRKTNKEFHKAMQKIVGFYEGLGVLVKEGLLDIRLVALLMTGSTLGFWRKIEPHAERVREMLGPRVWIETEYLAKRLLEYVDKHPEIEG